jgi:hypothetical protein
MSTLFLSNGVTVDTPVVAMGDGAGHADWIAASCQLLVVRRGSHSASLGKSCPSLPIRSAVPGKPSTQYDLQKAELSCINLADYDFSRGSVRDSGSRGKRLGGESALSPMLRGAWKAASQRRTNFVRAILLARRVEGAVSQAESIRRYGDGKLHG